MKKLLILTVMLSVFLTFTMAQKSNVEKYFKGEIALKSGDMINGYIYFDLEHTNDFQNSVSYLTNEQYERLKAGEKVKSKEIEEFKTKEVKYYKLEDGRKMNRVKYADLTAASAASFPKYYFFEQIAEGKVNLHKKYISIGAVVSGQLAMLDGQELIDHVNSTFTCLIQKGDENAKDLVNVKLQEYVEDDADILGKLEAGEYGTINTVFGSKMGSGNVDYTKYEENLVKLLNDYNK